MLLPLVLLIDTVLCRLLLLHLPFEPLKHKLLLSLLRSRKWLLAAHLLQHALRIDLLDRRAGRIAVVLGDLCRDRQAPLPLNQMGEPFLFFLDPVDVVVFAPLDAFLLRLGVLLVV